MTVSERLDTPAGAVAENVQVLARAVVRALDGDMPLDTAADDPVLLAAARVLGADVLAPSTLAVRAATDAEAALLDAAVRAFPPDPGSSASQWTHWGARVALGQARPGRDEPDMEWVTDETWPRFTSQLAGVAMLAALPPSTLTTVVARRVEDLARGFVRAVRRCDWRQAAGAGRWLAAVGDVPPSLGLDAGLEFVDMMGTDARVALDVRAARILRGSAVR